MTTQTLSKERLEKIATWREMYGDGHNVMLPAEEAEAMARALLAAHEQEPYGYVHKAIYETVGSCGLSSDHAAYRNTNGDHIPLYTHPAPSIPTSVPDELTREEYKRRFLGEDNFDNTFRGGWNACRAAMLQSEPQNAQQNIPDGLIAAINRLLDNDGSRGCYSAIRCYDAREEVERLLAAAQKSSHFRENSNSSTEHFRETGETSTKCWCHTCRPVAMGDMRFVVCPDCGNKRCPKANDHRDACSGSNEPGQEGSAYPASPKGV